MKREDDGDAEDGGVYGPRGDEAVALAPAAENSAPPEAPNFGLSGALAAETNTVNGVTLVYTEPVDKAPPPATKYRMYVFKDGHLLKDAEPLRVHRQSYYLFGRDRAVADIPTDHPSCSKQHAVLQYRSRSRYDDDAGLYVTESTPYLMDLEATNGTFINGERLDPRRYYQLLQKDCVKFGASTREYVLLAEDAARRGRGEEVGRDRGGERVSRYSLRAVQSTCATDDIRAATAHTTTTRKTRIDLIHVCGTVVFRKRKKMKRRDYARCVVLRRDSRLSLELLRVRLGRVRRRRRRLGVPRRVVRVVRGRRFRH